MRSAIDFSSDAPNSGLVLTSLRNSLRLIPSSSQSVSAVAVAARAERSTSASSPNIPPGPTCSTTLSPTEMATRPFNTTYMNAPAAPVLPTHELFPDPHLQDCGYWAMQDRRYIGVHFTPQAPFRHDGERPPVIRPAPTLGEHTAEVLAELGIVRETA